VLEKANYLKNNRENMNPNDVKKLEKLFENYRGIIL
jgi:hypothetical protein